MTDTTEPEDLEAAIAAAVAAGDYAEAARLQELSGGSSTDTFVDVDAAFSDATAADENEDKIVIRVLGRDWVFPAEIPTAVLTRLATWYSEHDSLDGMPNAEVLRLVGDLIPDRYLTAWSREGLSVVRFGGPDPRFMMIIGRLVEIYTDRMVDTANREARRRIG